MSRFRSINVSLPQYETEGIKYITVKSAHLKGRGDISVFIPPGTVGQADLPMVLLLHGVYSSHWGWTHRMGVHRTALEMMEQKQIRPMVLVMPSDGLWGDGSGYLPHADYDFEKWIVEDVTEVITEVIEAISGRSKKFITGLSMGGYGALRLGARFPHIFQGISAHSAITSFRQMAMFVEETFAGYQQVDPEKEDVIRYLVENKDHLPPLRFDCGKDDPLIEYNRLLHAQLTAEKIDHQYEEFAGGHEVEYWTAQVKKSLLFFDGLL